MNERKLDVICIGRSSVDLYGEQVGGRLEDMLSFAKYVGGCATNIAVGASRLGLRSALITRVGDEQMGRFIRETLIDEGVDVSHVRTDPDRLSALVILGIRDLATSPHIFYRENCADMAIEASDIDPAFIASAQAIVVTGTHFSSPGVEAASRAAMQYARDAGTRIVLDIDYRPVAWGLTSHGDGENRFIESEAVTRHVQSIVSSCDLIIGTEEEIHIAGGTSDTIEAVRTLRRLTQAVIVVKRGPMGCVVFPDIIPKDLEDGIRIRGREVEVYNTLGAGDGFMSGFLRGWIKGESWETCCEFANASGAIVVSRHGCSPAIPSWTELQHFLSQGSPERRLRDDKHLSHIHRATNRRKDWPEVCAIAFDHRQQFEDLLRDSTKKPEAISRFKQIIAEGACSATGSRHQLGVIVDDKYGFDTLAALSDGTNWIARPVELPGSRPLLFEAGNNMASVLRTWPESHIAKCLVHYHPQDEAVLKEQQINTVRALYDACLATSHELLLEVIPPAGDIHNDQATADAIVEFYEAGIQPDWWKLNPPKSAGSWKRLEQIVGSHDPYCRGIIMLGLNAPLADLMEDIARGAKAPVCKGFAVGRSIFSEAADQWFRDEITDAEASSAIARSYSALLETWHACRHDSD
ncbi:MAG: 5-dehydro-2-deoxygluconokinase [Rhodospirillales bacterium]